MGSLRSPNGDPPPTEHPRHLPGGGRLPGTFHHYTLRLVHDDSESLAPIALSLADISAADDEPRPITDPDSPDA